MNDTSILKMTAEIVKETVGNPANSGILTGPPEYVTAYIQAVYDKLKEINDSIGG
jgi:vacuolar-type H+-ATPase subunit E/Vma4